MDKKTELIPRGLGQLRKRFACCRRLLSGKGQVLVQFLILNSFKSLPFPTKNLEE